MLAWTLLLAVSSLARVPEAATGESARFVVVVGYNGGAPDKRPPLRFADDDAARTFQQLAPSSRRAWLLTTFDRESARVHGDLVDIARAPTRESLAQVLGEIAWLARTEKSAGRTTELVFAFAGHGDVDDAGEGFLLLADGPFTRHDLESNVLAASPADVNHVIIDACSSYFMVQARGGDESARVPLTPALLDVLTEPGLTAEARARTGVLVSTSSAAEVHESSELEAGVFSFLLRSALAGGADADGDGRVEYAEAAGFIAAASGGLGDPRARMSVHAEPPMQKPHAPLVDLVHSGATRFLVIDEAAHLRILDDRGVPYAEVRTTGSSKVHLALVGQPFFVVQRGDEEAVLVARSAGAYALGSLRFEERDQQGRGTPPGAALFTEAYGSTFLAGFLASATSLPPPRPGPPFTVAFADGGAERFRIPLGAVGWGTVGVATAVLAGAGAAAVANQLSFAALERDFAATGQLDPAHALEVERWRSMATTLGVAGLVVGAAGAGLLIWSVQLPEGEAELR